MQEYDYTNVMLLRAIVLLVPAALLFSYSLVLSKRKVPWAALQLLGATCLVIVVITHVCEALRLLPWMGWGAEHSAGHYLDLSSAVLGLTLFPAGYLIRLVTKRRVG
jgi:succinate dehydrogenase/fumarate reductase cytochrome b subunit